MLLTIRHAGIALALVLIAPIAANRLDSTVEQARLQGVAIVLDAPLDPQDKISLAPDLLASVEAREPRNALRSAVADNRDKFSGDDADAYETLGHRADDVLVPPWPARSSRRSSSPAAWRCWEPRPSCSFRARRSGSARLRPRWPWPSSLRRHTHWRARSPGRNRW